MIINSSLAIEITICVSLGIGVIIAFILYNRYNRIHQEKSNDDEQKNIEFLPTSGNEEFLVQNTLIAYYEQQRNELIERQK